MECVLLCGLLLIKAGLDRPVLLRDEGGDLLLPIGDHAEGGGLDSACGKSFFEFAPEQGAEPVSDDSVEDSAGLLSVYEVHVNFARVVEGLGYGGLGDFVEYDPANGLALDVGGFEEVPGDGFALPVGVGSQVYGFGALGGLGELLDGVLLVLWDFVGRCEVFGNIDAEPGIGGGPGRGPGRPLR